MVSKAGFAACVAAVVGCATVARAADDDWEHYRHDASRSGEQRHFSDLANPAKVPGLAIRWQWPPTAAGEGGMFYASPVVIHGRVFIGSTSGRFYALDANTGTLIWRYPPLPQPPLSGSCGSAGDVQAFGAYGILSSASLHKNTIIFGAPRSGPRRRWRPWQRSALFARSGDRRARLEERRRCSSERVQLRRDRRAT